MVHIGIHGVEKTLRATVHLDPTNMKVETICNFSLGFEYQDLEVIIMIKYSR